MYSIYSIFWQKSLLPGSVFILSPAAEMKFRHQTFIRLIKLAALPINNNYSCQWSTIQLRTVSGLTGWWKTWNAEFPVRMIDMCRSWCNLCHLCLRETRACVNNLGISVVVWCHMKNIIELTTGQSLCSLSHCGLICSTYNCFELTCMLNIVALLFHSVTPGNKLTSGLVCPPLPSDFPGEMSGRCAAERASPLLWKNRTKRRRASHPAENYNEQGTCEADIDSDSGYCSPKHNQAAGVVTQRPAEHAAAPTVC